jgi:type II secretory pathway pseudopilin PulG
VAGFTLVEILVVVAMMGFTMAAIFSVYQTHQKSAVTEEEIVEVQQNLRVAMVQITHDISMAGFLIPSSTAPIGNVGNDTGPNGTDNVTINIASATSTTARITSPTQDVTLAGGNTIDLAVSDLGGFDNDDVNTATVTIVGTQGTLQAVSNEFTVAAVPPTGACGAEVAPCLTLRAKAAGSGTITRGDMVVETGGAGYPNNNLTYRIDTVDPCPAGQTCIVVDDPAGIQILATNITPGPTGLQLSYVLDDGTEVDAPADPAQVQAVRVSLTGQTVVTTAYMGGNAKTRTLISLAKIRNR